jgi:sugar diacid utilization regulator
VRHRSASPSRDLHRRLSVAWPASSFGAHQQDAAALQIHPNTLAYRLRRFDEISGRTLRSTADLAELWLALRALGHLSVEQPAS